jgi:hypothetical protein
MPFRGPEQGTVTLARSDSLPTSLARPAKVTIAALAALLVAFTAAAPASADDGGTDSPGTEVPAPTPDQSQVEPLPHDDERQPVDEPESSPQGARAPEAALAAQITQPAQDSLWPSGSSIRITVTGLSSWIVEASCGSYVTVYSSNPYLTVDNPSTSDSLTCSADLYDSAWNYQNTVGFMVAPAEVEPNQIRNLTVSPKVFYPRVRDGYRDRVNFALGSRQDTQLWMYVRNSDGRLVRSRKVHSVDPWWNGYSRDRVSWNGENNNGRRVPTGRYRVTFESTGEGVRTARAIVTVTVSTGYRTVRRTKEADGWYGSRDTTRGNCYASEAFYPHGNNLDCWGGNYAQATYTFRIPRNASNLTWFARGERNCCSNGRVIKSGTRIAPERYQVRVRVTNWASFTVRKAGISYRTRVKI